MNFNSQPQTQLLPPSGRDSKPLPLFRVICSLIAITLPSIGALGTQPCLGQNASNANPLRLEAGKSEIVRPAPPPVASETMPSALLDLFNSGAKLGSLNQDTPIGQQQKETPVRAVDNQRIDSIKERITLLKNLMDQSDNIMPSTPKQFDSLPPPTGLTDTTSRSPGREPETNPETFQPSEVLVNPPPQLELAPPLLSKPISTIELGNSLFMIGRYEAAFRSYSQRLETKQAEDHWPRLATGCCQRQLMDFVDAELIFRQLANEVKAEGYLRDYATWNLDYIKHRQAASDDFKKLAAEFDSIKKEMDNE